MKTKQEIIANLLKAKKFFQENGRTTSTLYNEYTGCACLLGGVGIAAGSDPLEMHYGIFYEETPGYAEAGIAFEEAQALADNLPDSYFAEREYRTRDNADYTDVYYFNDHVVGYGPVGDQLVYDLIDRTVAALQAEIDAEEAAKAKATHEELYEELMDMPAGGVFPLGVGAAAVIRWLTEEHPDLVDKSEEVFMAAANYTAERMGIAEL